MGPHSEERSVAKEILIELLSHARVLQKRVRERDPEALKRVRILRECARLSDEALAREVKRRQCLAAVARQLGFQSWPHVRSVLLGQEQSDFGTLLYTRECHGHTNIWSAHYEEAREIREAHGGYLLAYRRQFFIVDRHFIESIALDPEDPDWERIGRDWPRARDLSARSRLYRQLIHNQLTLQDVARAVGVSAS
jgi:hypothetical protein